MQVDTNEIYKKFLGKMIKAVEKSDFDLCTNLSSEMIRVSYYLNLDDGIFIGEYLENLFVNLRSTVFEYDIEVPVINNLKIEIINLISILDSIPIDDNKKIDLYNLITNVRSKITILQLESFRGERTRKIKKKELGETMKRVANITDILE